MNELNIYNVDFYKIIIAVITPIIPLLSSVILWIWTKVNNKINKIDNSMKTLNNVVEDLNKEIKNLNNIIIKFENTNNGIQKDIKDIKNNIEQIKIISLIYEKVFNNNIFKNNIKL